MAADCVARRAGLTAELPVRKRPRAAVEVVARVVLMAGLGGVLGHRLPAGEANAGQVELPGPGMLTSVDAADLGKVLHERFAARLAVGAVVGTARHAITHHRIVLHAHAATGRRPGRLQWFPLDEATPWTTPSRKLFRAALGVDGGLRA